MEPKKINSFIAFVISVTEFSLVLTLVAAIPLIGPMIIKIVTIPVFGSLMLWVR